MATRTPLYQSPGPPGDQGTTGSSGDGSSAPTDVNSATYVFIASWLLLILLLTLLTRSRVGYVIAYYALLLMILVILVTEYKQIAPLLSPMTIGELDARS